MATWVQGTGRRHGWSGDITFTFTLPPTVGNSLLVLLSIYRSSPNFAGWTASDNYGNTYINTGGFANSGSIGAIVLVCPAVGTTGASFTITVTPAASSPTWTGAAVELAASPGLVVDQVKTLTGSGTAISSGSTPALVGDTTVLAAVMGLGANPVSLTVVSASPVYLEEYEELDYSNYVGGEGNTRLLGPAVGTTPSVSWTSAVSGAWAAVLVALKPNLTANFARTDTIAVADSVTAGFLPPIVVKADAVTVTEAVTCRFSQQATTLCQPNWAKGFFFNGTNGFFVPAGWTDIQVGTVEANVPLRMDQSGTIRRLAVRLASNSLATWTFVFRKNGVDQPVTVTLGAGEIYKADTVNSFTVAAGDAIAMRVAWGGSSEATHFSLVWEFEPTNKVGHYFIGGTTANALGTGSYYMAPFSAGMWTSTAVQGDALVGVAGDITSYRITLQTAPGGVATRTFVFEKNGVAQDGTGGTPDTTLVISGSGTTASRFTALSVVEGDLVRVRATSTGSPPSSRVIGTHSFAPVAPGELPLACSTSAPLSNGTSYAPGISDGSFVHTGSYADPELTTLLPAPIVNLTLRRLRVRLDIPLSSGSHVYTVRRSRTDTAQTVTVPTSGTLAGPSAGADVTFIAGDTLDLRAVTGSTGSTMRPHFAYAMAALIPGAISVAVVDAVSVTDTPTPVIRPQVLPVPLRIEGISIADDLEVRQTSATLLTINIRDTIRVRDDVAMPGHLRGFTRVQVSPRVATGFAPSIAVTLPNPPAAGNGIVVVVAGFATSGATFSTATCADNQGNPYQRVVAKDHESSIGEGAGIFYCPAVAISGSPFTITASFSKNHVNWMIAYEVRSGGWGLRHDQSASNTQATSYYDAVTTGSTPPLTANDAFLAAIFSATNNSNSYIHVTPATPVWEAVESALTGNWVGEADTRIVTKALGTTPYCSWYLGNTFWTASVLAAFKTGSAFAMPGTAVSLRLAEVIETQDVAAPLRRPAPLSIYIGEAITARETRVSDPGLPTPQVLTPQGFRMRGKIPPPRTGFWYGGPWPTGDLTVCFWAKDFGWWDLENDDWYYEIGGVNYAQGPMFRLWGGEGITMQLPADTRWHHWAVVSRVSGSLGVTYSMDGGPPLVIAIPVYPPYADEILSGGTGTGGEFSYVAYYRMWSAILTPTEIKAERQARQAVRTADLWRDTPLEGTLLDRAGNNRHWVHSPSTPISDVNYYGGPLPWVADGIEVQDAVAATVQAKHERFAVELLRTTDVARIGSTAGALNTCTETVRTLDTVAFAPHDPRTAKRVRWYTTRLATASYYPPALRGSWDTVGNTVSGGGGTALRLVYTPLPPYDQYASAYHIYGVTQAGAAGSTTHCMSSISQPLPAQVISGLVNISQYVSCSKALYLPGGAAETAGAVSIVFRIYAYVTVGETDSVRGVLLDYTAPLTGNKWPRGSNRWLQLDADTLLSPVALQTGDRLVIEWGFKTPLDYLTGDYSQYIGYIVTTSDKWDDATPLPPGQLQPDAPLTFYYNGWIDFKSGVYVTPLIIRVNDPVRVFNPMVGSISGRVNKLVADAVTVSDVRMPNFALPTAQSGADTITVTDAVTGSAAIPVRGRQRGGHRDDYRDGCP